MKRLFLPLLVLALLVPSTAGAWWNSDWKVRKKITINTSPAGAAVKEDVGPALVPVRLHSGNFLFSDAKVDGTDLRFVASDDKTPLRYFIERFDSANQLAIAWVQLPRIAGASSAESFWMYSGNEKAAAADDPRGAYDAAQLLALEFGEAALPFRDGSSLASPVSADRVRPDASGLFAGAAAFDGGVMTVNAAPGARVAAGGALTVSAWIRPAGPQAARLWSWGDLHLDLDGAALSAKIDGAGGGASATARGGELRPGQWNHVAMVVQDRITLFVNGAAVASEAAKLPDLSGPMQVGNGFSGSIDSLGVLGAARPPAWVQLVAAEGTDSRLLGYGEPEATDEEGPSYIKILFSSLTIDAKVVIAILAFMFAIAVAVMVAKARLLARTAAQNADFIAEFEKSPEFFLPDSGPAKRAAGGDFDQSPLARIFETGMRELHVRLRERKQLSPQSVAAIRASIDSTMVRESQRLNARMVLLTIAISGGPFLGLLGTVIGVMITFASIAAQGDVNINAIAPGIAAALLATVAGLTVAIPSLFGYNYLITRIKSISADMQAFGDEFLSKMAEEHN